MVRGLFQTAIVFLMVFELGCGGDGTADSPEKLVELLYKYISAGEMTKAKTLCSVGDFHERDADRLRNLFGDDDIVNVDAEVIEVTNPTSLRADVWIYLNKTGERLRSRSNLPLVFQDGGWKVHYKASSWPKALNHNDYFQIPSKADDVLSDYAENILDAILTDNTELFMNRYAFTQVVDSSYRGPQSEESFLSFRGQLSDQFINLSNSYKEIDWILAKEFVVSVYYDAKSSMSKGERYFGVNISMKYEGESKEFHAACSLNISHVFFLDGKYYVFQF